MNRNQTNPVRRPDPARFKSALTQHERQYAIYGATCPQPLLSQGLLMTAELRYQCELYLPIAELQRLFNCFYRASLYHEPILSSTSLYNAPSWADYYLLLPEWLQASPNPAVFLRQLLQDGDLHERFIYHSFLPGRFNGTGFGRYSSQRDWVLQYLKKRHAVAAQSFTCLDAACGSGEGVWELAETAHVAGWLPEQITFTGWTLDPLEVYAAQHRYLPHGMMRQTEYRTRIAPLVAAGWEQQVTFQAVDLLSADLPDVEFDLIRCNGLLGGPIIHQLEQISRVLHVLADRLKPGGSLLADNKFHGGWRKVIPNSTLADLFRQAGLDLVALDEGLIGTRSRA